MASTATEQGVGVVWRARAAARTTESRTAGGLEAAGTRTIVAP